MKFILHEVKLWFHEKNQTAKSYEFLPNKINVITGASTTGKTSFWNIIDYCLLAEKENIASEVNDKVKWFGIRFSINNKEITILRRSKVNNVVSSDIYFGFNGFPVEPYANFIIGDAKNFLDREFGVEDNFKYPLKKIDKNKSLILSYRHFLLFNSLTQMMVDAPETYFDTTHYGKKEYDQALPYVFDLATGIRDFGIIAAKKRIDEIEAELTKIKKNNKIIIKENKEFNDGIFEIINQCKKLNVIDYDQAFDDQEEALKLIQKSIDNIDKSARNEKILEEIDSLSSTKRKIKTKIFSINQYQKEYDLYRKNLEKYADSLQPIKFIQENLSDQLIDSYEVKTFIEVLESSLMNIKNSINKKPEKPLNFSVEIDLLNKELNIIEEKIKELSSFQDNFQSQADKLISIGEVKHALRDILNKKPTKTINVDESEKLYKELMVNKELINTMPQRGFKMSTLLDGCIQRNFDLIKSLSAYKDSRVVFNKEISVLQLYPYGQLFPLDNIGSASNYMFLHLCFFLGFHEHIILNTENKYVPEFLFIDQPSQPYFGGDSDDESKLLDVFNLLNLFLKFMVEDNEVDFQILLVEHASKDYWVNNNFEYFHTVDEFLGGKGLIPKEVFNR